MAMSKKENLMASRYSKERIFHTLLRLVRSLRAVWKMYKKGYWLAEKVFADILDVVRTISVTYTVVCTTRDI